MSCVSGYRWTGKPSAPGQPATVHHNSLPLPYIVSHSRAPARDTWGPFMTDSRDVVSYWPRRSQEAFEIPRLLHENKGEKGKLRYRDTSERKICSFWPRCGGEGEAVRVKRGSNFKYKARCHCNPTLIYGQVFNSGSVVYNRRVPFNNSNTTLVLKVRR